MDDPMVTQHLAQDMALLESALAVIVGIGLAASCGFRVFVPLLVVSGAASAGYLDVAENLRWLASPATVQGGTVAARLASTATTGGLANFVVNTVETIFGAAFSVLAIVVPVVALVLLVVVVTGMYYVGRRVVGAVLRREGGAARVG